jgi:hypothetical protein
MYPLNKNRYHHMKLKLSFFVFLFISLYAFTQQLQLSENSQVSVITIGPGESLNDAFGHNAFRIKDRNLQIDVAYGYGEYDFDAPNFYLKFAQGKLNYLISKHNFSDIYRHYVNYNRTIEEQVLNLSTEEKQRLFDYLENNYKPENRRYLYDFFYDNCATRIRDVTKIATRGKVDFEVPENIKLKTFRDLIHDHVGLNTWGSFGIDIALGAVIDKQATPYEYMFLPKYIHDFFGTAKVNGTQNLVTDSNILFQRKETKAASSFLLSPVMIMGVLAVLILFLTYKDYRNNTRNKWLDIALFGVTGIVGVVILLLWFATDHSATVQNYNLLWAMPLNIILIGQILKPQVSNWFKSYLKFLIIMLCLMTLHWTIGVQVFAIGLIPIVIALFLRYLYLVKFYNKKA